MTAAFEAFIDKKFAASSLAIIEQANTIIGEYAAQGFKLTLRQLYYQFVARDLIANTQRSYKRLGNIISEARMAGRVDWNAIEDRTRNLESNPHWDDPAAIIEAAARSFRIDKWENQPCRVEVWIEKEALIGVVSGSAAGWTRISSPAAATSASQSSGRPASASPSTARPARTWWCCTWATTIPAAST